MADENRHIHYHNHLWPDSDCGCYAMVALIALFVLIYSLGQVGALPWQ